MNETTYRLPVECGNCFYRQYIDIPRGTRLSELRDSPLCENCGCAGPWQSFPNMLMPMALE